MTANPGGEQFAPIPARAMGDTRLSAGDVRVLIAIAYHDRFGRNGSGCYADPRKIAERAKVRAAHWSRHTNRLFEFGYITIELSVADRRRRVYRVIYDNAKAGAAADTVSINASAEEKNVKKNGVVHREIVTNADLQVPDPQRNPHNLRDPVKQTEDIPQSGCSFGGKSGSEFNDIALRAESAARSSAAPFAASDPHEPGRQRFSADQKPTMARQKKRAASSGNRQRELPVLSDVNKELRARRWREAEQRLARDIRPCREWFEDALRHGFRDVCRRAVAIEFERPGAGANYVARCVARAERE